MVDKGFKKAVVFTCTVFNPHLVHTQSVTFFYLEAARQDSVVSLSSSVAVYRTPIFVIKDRLSDTSLTHIIPFRRKHSPHL